MMGKWRISHLMFLPLVATLNLVPMRRLVPNTNTAPPTTEAVKHILDDEMNGNSIEYDLQETNTKIHREQKRQAEAEAEPADSAFDYRFHSEALPWMDALATCWRDGQRLAMPRTRYQALTLGAKLTNAASDIQGTDMRDALYIGVNQVARQGRWMSCDGTTPWLSKRRVAAGRQRSELGFATWLGGPSAQSGGRDQQRNCGALLSDGSFIQVQCGERLAFACEPDTDILNEQPPPGAEGYSPAGRLGLLKLHDATPLPWLQARAACEREGAHLAVPETRRVAMLLAKAMSTSTPQGFFIGVNDLAEEGDWHTIFGRSVANSGFNMWADGEPSGGRAENCGLLLPEGLFAAAPCSKALPFVCKKGASPIVASVPSDPYKQMQKGEKSYSLHLLGLDWMASAGACRRENATLAFPESEEEALDLMRMLNGTWEHMRNVHNRCFLNVGVHDLDGDGVWTTIFGEPLEQVGYGNWSTRWRQYPENNGNRCAMMDCNGQYMNYPCGNRYAYVCVKTIET